MKTTTKSLLFHSDNRSCELRIQEIKTKKARGGEAGWRVDFLQCLTWTWFRCPEDITSVAASNWSAAGNHGALHDISSASYKPLKKSLNTRPLAEIKLPGLQALGGR